MQIELLLVPAVTIVTIQVIKMFRSSRLLTKTEVILTKDLQRFCQANTEILEMVEQLQKNRVHPEDLISLEMTALRVVERFYNKEQKRLLIPGITQNDEVSKTAYLKKIYSFDTSSRNTTVQKVPIFHR